MEYLINRITIDPYVCNGRPAIRGKGITVQTILEFLAAGDTKEDILEGYPSLELEDIEACIQFMAKMMAHSYSYKAMA